MTFFICVSSFGYSAFITHITHCQFSNILQSCISYLQYSSFKKVLTHYLCCIYISYFCLLVSKLHTVKNSKGLLAGQQSEEDKLSLTIREEMKTKVLSVKKNGNSGTWHGARDSEYSQLYINFQTRSHWTTVIRPQNGNKSAHWRFCHCDL